MDLFDPADAEFLDDPYPTFARLRESAPVQWHEGLGMYLALSHAACDSMLRERTLGRVWHDREPAEQFPAFNLLHRHSILENEPPTHTRLRRLVAGAFGRGHVERLRPWVAELAERLVEDLGEALRNGPADLLEVVAAPLPVEVIAELLGVPAADRANLRPWSNAIVKMYEYRLDEQRRGEAERAAREFVAYLRDLVADRRAHLGEPGQDLASDLVRASDGQDRLSEDEVVATCVLLLMAGHEATVNVVGNGMRALLQRPQAWAQLVADPALVPSATEELVRFDSSLQLFERTALQDVEVSGTAVPQGTKIAALLGAAGRDPAVFDEPDTLRLNRSPNPHLGFGAGIHFCLGAPLARVEVQAALTALISQLPHLQLAGEAPRRGEFVIRGLAQLPVAVA